MIHEATAHHEQPGLAHLDEVHEAPRWFLTRYVFSTNHKIIGLQFLFTGLVFFLLGGLMALAVRWQLAWPWSPVPGLSRMWGNGASGGLMSPEYYNKLFTMHGSVMIFFVVIPILNGAFGNYLIPLMIGARDMAFPRMNMISYWFMWPASACALYSFAVVGGAPEAGWTSYPPLAVLKGASPGTFEAQTWWLASLLFAGISSIMGSINYVTTVVMLRAPGMKMFRLPMTVWGLFITALLQAFALPVLTSALAMQLLDRVAGTHFFVDPGQPLLWQHLFWFYSHPAVYVMILPAMGMVSDIIATNSRKPLFGYRPMVIAIAAIALLGFVVWGHHMFQSGMNPAVGTGFMLATILIAVPSAIKVFNWLGTMWGGAIHFTTAMLNAIAFVSMFIIGGLSGIFMASIPTDMHIHDTYFIVAHLHYVLFGGSTFAIFAAIYYWYPKMFGRLLSEGQGKAHFVLSFLAFNGTFLLMHIVGLHGQPRRYADASSYMFLNSPAIRGMNEVMTVSAFVLGAAQLILVFNFFTSLFLGCKADANPWRSTTLEWTTASPPPWENYATIPTVYHAAYEYALPETPDDYLPQDQPMPPASESPDPGMEWGLPKP
jgi:cytochrome c oxidase subunit 1